MMDISSTVVVRHAAPQPRLAKSIVVPTFLMAFEKNTRQQAALVDIRAAREFNFLSGKLSKLFNFAYIVCSFKPKINTSYSFHFRWGQ